MAPGPEAGPVQNQPSVDMNTRGVQSGSMGGGPTAAQNLQKVLHNLPGNALGLLNTLIMPALDKFTQVGTEIAKSGAEVVTKSVVDTGSKAAGNLLLRLLKVFLPKL